jgi:hypothetical protein
MYTCVPSPIASVAAHSANHSVASHTVVQTGKTPVTGVQSTTSSGRQAQILFVVTHLHLVLPCAVNVQRSQPVLIGDLPMANVLVTTNILLPMLLCSAVVVSASRPVVSLTAVVTGIGLEVDALHRKHSTVRVHQNSAVMLLHLVSRHVVTKKSLPVAIGNLMAESAMEATSSHLVARHGSVLVLWTAVVNVVSLL